MKLSTRGLLIVSVPVFAQVILVSVMSLLVWRANTIAIQQAKTKAILFDCNMITATALDCVQREFSRDDFTEPLSTMDIVHLKEQVQSLKQKLSAERRQTREFNELSKITTEFVPFLTAVKDHRLEVGGSKLRSEKLLFEKLDETTALLGAIISSVNTLHRSDPEEIQKARLSLRIAVVAFIIINVILTMVLAFFASTRIRKPLILMVKNAEHIANRIELALPLEGSDEIASVDRRLHQVDQSIDEALATERNLIRFAGHLICSIDDQGFFKQVNPYSFELLGFSPHDLEGASVHRVVTSGDIERVIGLCDSVDRSASRVVSEIKMIKGNGKIIDTAWSTSWSNTDKSLFCVIHDITERKITEQIKQDFLAMLSHDLRTPLMSVQSSVDTIRSGKAGFVAPQAQVQLEAADRNAEHLIGLINDLLDFEKLEAGKMIFDQALVSVKHIFNESVALVMALADESGITVRHSSDEYVVYCDEHKITQVLVNLLSNAMKHSPESSTIEVRASAVADAIEISVHDQGPGVPDEYRQSIFAPFEQISDRPTAKLGTGLGLAICKSMVEGQGGAIGVRPSEFLTGSAFWFTLPLPPVQALQKNEIG